MASNMSQKMGAHGRPRIINLAMMYFYQIYSVIVYEVFSGGFSAARVIPKWRLWSDDLNHVPGSIHSQRVSKSGVQRATSDVPD